MPKNHDYILQQTHLDAIFGTIATAVIWFNLAGDIISCNQPALDTFDYSSDEMHQLQIQDLITKEGIETGASILKELTQCGQHSSSHHVSNLIGHKKDSRIFHLDLLLSCFRLDGAIRFMGLIQDISDLKQTEWKLNLAFKVFDSMNEAVLVSNAENRCIQVNQAFTRITGYSNRELIGKNPRILASGRHNADFYKNMWDSLNANGYWEGEVWNRRKNGEIFPQWLSIVVVKDDNNQVQNYIAVSSDTTERKDADERLHFLAHYDPLTNLPNRSLLHDRLLQSILYAKRQNTKVAVFFLDLDRFKTINDTLGHSIGDLLLQSVAERLTSSTRNSDTIARLGGDEFIIILPDLRDTDHAGRIAQKVLDSIARPHMIREMELHTTASIGISIFPDDGTSNEELISNADVAMYRAKDNGKNTYQFYAPMMNTSSYERLTVENKLRRALEREEFILHYQPQIDVTTGKIIGTEALVRWQNPEIGLVPPDMFISLAEENGLIVPIGEWVLREACRQNNSWHKQGLGELSIAVNLSAMQFHQKNLAQMIEQVLRETGLSSDHLELEITETGIMKHSNAISTMLELKEMGIRLAIDDFGTGYSSLSHLKRFPLDKLKIDKSFVRDVTTNQDDAAIVTAIIAMAKSLKLKTIAEGVETREHCDFLCSNDCYEMQGYFFSRPLPAREFEQLMLKGC